MTITINGTEYAFEVNGTVGLVYLAQRILGEEEFNGQDFYHQIVLYYAAFHQSNKNTKNLPDLQDFTSNLTSKMMKEMGEYFWNRWNELEGTAPEPGKTETKGED